ncbi:MAG: ferritin-like domain-containing protein [Pseudomonadota bacterium]
MVIDAASAANSVLCAETVNSKISAVQATLRLGGNDFDAFATSHHHAPDRPGRPTRPVLSEPANMPKRGLGSEEGRFALLHAIAHIEFNAIDLAFDIALRFRCEIDSLGLSAPTFASDWFRVGQDEARHFEMIQRRLESMGGAYGDLDAHNGLWEAAYATRHNLLARLVVAPLILEARGLDVTPGMIRKLRGVGDRKSAEILKVIFNDEISHVATGNRWFHKICNVQGVDPRKTFHALQNEFFPAGPKPPFNVDAREQAGLPIDFYSPI